MVGRSRLTRFDRIEKSLTELPLRPFMVRRAFEYFRATGELPEERRVAEAVTKAAMAGDHIVDTIAALCEQSRLLRNILAPRGITVVSPRQSKNPQTRSVREVLFAQAVSGEDVLQLTARMAIQWLVTERGEDVCSSTFAASYGLPRGKLVGLHIFGYPQCFALPPHEAQAHRLFARLDELRERIDYRDPDWAVPIAEASARFASTGELPTPGVTRDSVLILHELGLLIDNRKGIDVSKPMAAIDRVWQPHGEEREAAIANFRATRGVARPSRKEAPRR